jgi:hypothetical protein
MPVRVPPKLQRRRKGHGGVVGKTFETASIQALQGTPKGITTERSEVVIPYTPRNEGIIIGYCQAGFCRK